MKLYQFTTPTRDGAFEDALVSLAGGFTRVEGRGAWRAPNGHLHYDAAFVYSVADGEGDSDFVRDVLALLVKTWPEEQSFFWARIGDAFFEQGKGGTLDASDEPKQDAASDRHEYFTE